MVKGNDRLLGLVAIGNQSADDVDQAVDWAAVTRMLNLGNVLQLKGLAEVFDAAKQFFYAKHGASRGMRI